MKPQMLDLFCGAGGAGMGYARAGLEVVGVDINPQPDYPFEFHQGDALKFLREHGHRFDAIHASPPCQAYSTGVVSRSSKGNHTKGKDEPALINDVHRLLVAIGRPWVIENVMGARPQMPGAPFVLCGSMFNRPIPRHLVNALCRPLVYLLDLADRDVCKWAQDTDEECPACPFPDDRPKCCHDGNLS